MLGASRRRKGLTMVALTSWAWIDERSQGGLCLHIGMSFHFCRDLKFLPGSRRSREDDRAKAGSGPATRGGSRLMSSRSGYVM
jgi:hypothetical protein